MKVEFEDKDRLYHDVVEHIANQLLHGEYGGDSEGTLGKQIARRIDEIVTERCAQAATDVATEQLTPRIAKILDENSWTYYPGNYDRSPVKLTLRDMVAKTVESPDSYRQRDHFVTKLIDTRITEALKTEFDAHIKAAGAELRKRIDSILGEKVSLAVREAIGLR